MRISLSAFVPERALAETDLQTAIADGELTKDEVSSFIAPHRALLATDPDFRRKVELLPTQWEPYVKVTPEACDALNALLAQNPPQKNQGWTTT